MVSLLQFLGAQLLLTFDLKGNDESLFLDQLWKHVTSDSFHTPVETFYTHLCTSSYWWEATIAQKSMISLKCKGEVLFWDHSLPMQ